MKTLEIGMLLFPRITQLDLTGPFEVLSRLSACRVHLIWKSLDPVTSDSGLGMLPTTTFAACPQLDVVLVPGGPGQIPLMEDQEVLEFLRIQSVGAQYMTSVCTGSLVLGAAGLLRGYRAACHWMSRDLLSEFGAEPVADRIVCDRDRITGGGVTAGIDFALILAARLRSEAEAQAIALQLEYRPAPPFAIDAPELEAMLRARAAGLMELRRTAVERARRALGT